MSLEAELWYFNKRYGYSAGEAHPSVEWVKCPLCGAEVGELCTDDNGRPKLTRHVKRCDAFRELRREWVRIGLEERASSPGRRTTEELLRELRQKGESPDESGLSSLGARGRGGRSKVPAARSRVKRRR